MKIILLFVCLSLCWVSVNCQDEENDEEEQGKSPNIYPIPDQSQIQLKDKFCFSYSCLANLTDPLEADKVLYLSLYYVYGDRHIQRIH